MVEQAIEKARVLIEALPYIQKFRDETIVVKFGGSMMNEETQYANILKDVAFMACVGMRPVIVHGGGNAISKRMNEKGMEPRFHHGLRITDEDTIGVVEQVLNYEVNPHLVDILKMYDCKAWGVHGDDILKVAKKSYIDAESGEPIDLGYVGEVLDIDTEPIRAYLDAHMVPVITPLGRGTDHHAYNINADEAAAAVAKELKARKLVFLSDVPGLLKDPSDPATRISSLKLSEVEDLIASGVIRGGMQPKIGGAVKALKAGVMKTHIVDASLPHSLLLELFTDEGVGTEIVQ